MSTVTANQWTDLSGCRTRNSRAVCNPVYGTLRRAAGGRQPRLLPKCEPPPARAAGHLSLRGSLLFDGLTRLRAARRRDRDPPRLHCFWNLAHQFDLQQTVLKCCSLHPHEIGEAEGAAEARAEMP